MSEPIVRLEHCRRLKYCSRGVRAFFIAHGINWDKFRTVGLPADEIAATGDAMAIAAATLAREEAQQGKK